MVCLFVFILKIKRYCDQNWQKDVELDLERNLRAGAVERINQMEQTLRTLNQECASLRQQCEERDPVSVQKRLRKEQVQRLGGRRRREGNYRLSRL